MGLAEQRKKSSAMAAYMKKHGIERDTTACPHCHKATGLNAKMLSHMMTCKGTRRVRARH